MKAKLFTLAGLLIIITALFLRIQFLFKMPAGNDEAFYIYDAYNISKGLVPYKDFLTKSVPFVFSLSLWQRIVGHDLLLNRTFTIIVSLLTGYIIYLLSKKLSTIAALLISAIFLSDSFVASRSVFTVTNFPFILTYLLALFLFDLSLKKKKIVYILLTSLTIIISFYTRQIGIFLIPTIFLYSITCSYEDRSKTTIAKRLLTNLRIAVAITALSLITVITIYLISARYMGSAKANESIALSIIKLNENLSQNSLHTSILLFISRAKQILYSFFALLFASPLYFMGLTATLGYFSLIIFGKKMGLLIMSMINIFTILYFVYLSKLFMHSLSYGGAMLFYRLFLANQIILTVFTTISLILLNRRFDYIPRKFFWDVLFFSLSILTLISFYMFNIRFDYSLEYYPLLAILTGLLILEFFKAKGLLALKLVYAVAVVSLIVSSYFYNTLNINTGSHKLSDFYDATKIIQTSSTSNDKVFTGFPIFALQAEREVVLNVSHASWYGYKFIDERYRDIFLPNVNAFYKELIKHPPKFVVIDGFTRDSYLKQYPRIAFFIKNNYRLVKNYPSFQILIYKSR